MGKNKRPASYKDRLMSFDLVIVKQHQDHKIMTSRNAKQKAGRTLQGKRFTFSFAQREWSGYHIANGGYNEESYKGYN